MKGIEKITSVRVAEILTERSIVSSEVITDALYAQDRHGEPFAQVLITGGHITEWDLAKIITENFSLPFLMAGHYQISDDAKKKFPKELLFKHTLVPLDVFGDIVCVAMPVMLSFEEINKIQKEHNCDLFPYVGLVSENKKVLSEMHRDYPQWIEQDQKRREEESKRRQSTSKSPGDWMSIFDAGDQAIQEMKKKPDPTPAAAPKVTPAEKTPPAAPRPTTPPPKK